LWDDQAMYVSVLTREYPPTIYGGAGVHVAQLVPQLRTLIDVDVQCMGQPREGATAQVTSLTGFSRLTAKASATAIPPFMSHVPLPTR
jgi:hypothetical protein